MAADFLLEEMEARRQMNSIIKEQKEKKKQLNSIVKKNI